MEETLSDLDTLLGSDPHFLLGSWTQSALNFSTSINETILYDLNSRNQVTLWGPQGQVGVTYTLENSERGLGVAQW